MEDNRPVKSVVEHIAVSAELWSSIPGSVKSHTVSPTARTLQRRFFGARLLRFFRFFVTCFGVVPPVGYNEDFIFRFLIP